MLSSVVSSQSLAKMAQMYGFTHVETLTGFKWLGNKARELKVSYQVPFAYEEAIGFMFPALHYDKDGIAAAFVFSLVSSAAFTAGLSLSEWLDSLEEK